MKDDGKCETIINSQWTEHGDNERFTFVDDVSATYTGQKTQDVNVKSLQDKKTFTLNPGDSVAVNNKGKLHAMRKMRGAE